MNNYYTLIYLIREWKDKLKNSHFVEAVSTRKNQLELFFELETSFRLVCSTAGQHAAIFLDRYQEPQRRNTVTFFDELKSARVIDIILANRDRHIRMVFDDGRELVFLMYSNHANVVLSSNDKVIKSFKREKLLINQSTPKPKPDGGIIVEPPFENVNTLLKGFDPLLPKPVLRLALKPFNLPEDADQAISRLKLIINQINDNPIPHFSEDYGFSIIDPSFLGNSPDKTFDSVNQGVAYTFFKWIKFQDFESKRIEIQKKIERNIARTNSAISDLKHGIRSKSNAEAYEKYGHLLMANQHLKLTSTHVEIEDLFESGSIVQIPVDPSLDMVMNAQKYYEKSRGVKKSHQSYVHRLNEFEMKLNELNSLKKSLSDVAFAKDLNKWIKKNELMLKRIGHLELESSQIAQSYRSFSTDNFEIRVGKSASHNDELLKISHKEDIWLHARGVPGSHVIILMNRSNGFPPNHIIEKAAEIAAFYSKAKGSSLVPVIFTKKKHVRKGKGLPPGAVFVDKEDVILVKPVEPSERN